MKYTDPDGEFIYDPHNSKRIIANLDDIDDLRAAANAIANTDCTITAYGETSGITRNFNNYSEINEFINPSKCVKINLVISKAQSEGNGARAFFFDGQYIQDPKNGNCNVNTNFGIADVTIPISTMKDGSISVDLQAISASGLLGSDGNRQGFDVDASIVKGSLNIGLKLGNKKVNVTFEGMIGASASFLLSVKEGIKIGAALGPGGSISVKVEDFE